VTVDPDRGPARPPEPAQTSAQTAAAGAPAAFPPPPIVPPVRRTALASDGYVLHGRWWAPNPAASASKAPRTAFLYLHGIQSHGGWYERSGSVLAEATGGAVWMPDRRGSGLNDADRGDVADSARWLADIDEQIGFLRAETGADRLGIVGVSWGGKLAAAWMASRLADLPHLDVSALLITPGVYPAVDIGWYEKLSVGVSLFRRPTQQFEIPLSDPGLFSADPVAQAWIAADPLKLTHVTARFLFQSRRLDRVAQRAPDASFAGRLSVLLAGEDEIIRNAETARWTRRVDPQARLHTFPGVRHTLEFGAAAEEFWAMARAWACELPRL
jgi:alpha-beta hydrolase superfamily lysophospholipase